MILQKGETYKKSKEKTQTDCPPACFENGTRKGYTIQVYQQERCRNLPNECQQLLPNRRLPEKLSKIPKRQEQRKIHRTRLRILARTIHFGYASTIYNF